MSKILVVGTGAFGTALANVLLENGHVVNMYGINEAQMEDIKKGYNKEFFGNKKLVKKPNLVTTDFPEAIKGMQYLVIAVPSKYIQDTLRAHKKYIKPSVIIINSSKGIDPISKLNYFTLIHKVLPRNKICAIAGPSFAKELFECKHTIVNMTCKDLKVAQKAAKLFENKYFKVRAITDTTGASLISALKNGLAVCCGMLNEQGHSINTIAAVITRGVEEINNYILQSEGESTTALQYCGLGDVYLTCSSDKSRNYRLGQAIAKKGVKKALLENNLTIEGVEIIQDIHSKISKNNKYALFNLLYDLIEGKIAPNKFIDALWEKI